MNLLIIALAPAIALIVYVYYRDKHDREPLGLVLRVFIFGMLSTIPAALLEQYFNVEDKNNLIVTAYSTFLIIAGAEEGSKYLFLRWSAYRKIAFNEPFDGIVYSVIISMGFAALENILYVFSSSNPLQTALLRMLTAVPAHFTFAVIMGYYVGLAKYNPVKRIQYTMMGIGGAMFFHGLYDFCLIQNKYPYIVTGALISLIVALYLSFKALKIQSANSKAFMELASTQDQLYEQ